LVKISNYFFQDSLRTCNLNFQNQRKGKKMSIDTNYNPHLPSRYKNPYTCGDETSKTSATIAKDLLAAKASDYLEQELASRKVGTNNSGFLQKALFFSQFASDKSTKAMDAKSQIGDIIKTYA
jgi:hypothetical protein